MRADEARSEHPKAARDKAVRKKNRRRQKVANEAFLWCTCCGQVMNGEDDPGVCQSCGHKQCRSCGDI